jgi:hypothetical protein
MNAKWNNATTTTRPSPLGNSLKELTANLLLGLATVLVCAGVAEALATFFPKSHFLWDYRFMYHSENSVLNHQGYWTFTPNQWIREAAIYDFGVGEGIVEYDTWFHTNNYGLVQGRDLVPGMDSIAVFGDSFTQGLAAAPWFIGFERTAHALLLGPQEQLLNFGFEGAVPAHWRAQLAANQEPLRIRQAVMVFIGADWVRPPLDWTAEDLRCNSNHKLCNGGLHMQSIPEGVDWGMLRRLSRERYFVRRGDMLGSRLAGIASRYSNFYPFISQFVIHYLDNSDEKKAATAQRLADNLAILQEMHGLLGGRMAFVAVPARDEGAAGAFNIHTQAVLKYLEGFPQSPVVRCKLDRADYHPWDSHPTQAGYEKVSVCVLAALTRLKQLKAVAVPPAPPKVAAPEARS